MNAAAFEAGFSIEIMPMHEETPNNFRIAAPGEAIAEYSVLAKEYHTDGEITLRFDEEFPTLEQAQEAARPWEERWGIEAEYIEAS